MSSKEKVNILVVDDKEANVLALEAILESPDLNIVKTYSGNEALAKLLEMDFACLILDVKMPDMDGLELTRIIRSDERTRYIPILFASGHQQTEVDIFKGYETGAVDYLLKPLDPTVVRSKVSVFAELFRKELACKRVEEQLKRSNEDLDHFASVAAHDLQAPLRAIAGGSKALSEDFKDKLGQDGEKWLKMISENVKRMENFIDDLLSYSKVGTEHDLLPLKLTGVMSEVLQNLALPIKESGAKVHYENLPGTVHAGRSELHQLLQNLIGNAIKYRKKDAAPEIKVSVEDENGDWHFQIADNGIGMEAQFLGKIFIIFRRLHNKEYPGTGIGLAVCKKIVERRGGRIWVESTLGKGSTFHFLWPRIES